MNQQRGEWQYRFAGKTIRVVCKPLRFDIPAVGASAKIVRKFVGAKKWRECHVDVETGKMIRERDVVQHPEFPDCIAWHELKRDTQGGLWPRRGLEDDGSTPVSEISQLVRFMTLAISWRERRRRGGPVPTPVEVKTRIVRGWIEVQGRENQNRYAKRKGVSARHLRNWIQEFMESGRARRWEDGTLEWLG